MKRNKIAVIHDILIDYGGAERALESFLRDFKNCDLYTFYFDSKSKTMRRVVGKIRVRSSLFQFVPIKHLGRFVSFLKPFAWLYFYLLRIPDYQTIVSFSSSYNAKLVRKRGAQRHVSYIFTPPKYLYKETNDLVFIKKFPFNLILKPIFAVLRLIDKNSVQNIDLLIAISNTVKRRIKKYYDRNSDIIYPPVNIQKPTYKIKKGNHYLFLSRLVKQKGLDLITELASKYDIKIKIAGAGYMQKKLPFNKNIEYLGFVPENEISDTYAKARATIYCAKDEDFGLVPVESMYCGTPVVAFKSGGVEETVVNKKSGIFFESFSVISLYKAIKKLERINFRSNSVKRYAEKYKNKYFLRKFKKVLG